MLNVSREDFQNFLKVRASGRINMTDIVTGSSLARISETTYETILFNFSDLAKEYGTKIDKEVKPVRVVTKSNEITRICKSKSYSVEFYTIKNGKIGKLIGLCETKGASNIYDIVALAPKACKNRIPGIVHVIEMDSDLELWQTIGLVPGTRITNHIEYYR